MAALKSALFCIIICFPSLAAAQLPVAVIRTIGVEADEESPFMFGLIVGLAIDEEMNIYVLDRYAYEIRVFNWHGEHLRLIGKGKGFGPGEFSLPMGLSIGPGGTLYVADYDAGRITLYSSYGEFLGQIPGMIAFSPPTVLDNEHIYMATGGVNWTRPLMRQYSLAGKVLREAVDPIINGKEIAFSGASMVSHAPTPDGRIIVVRPYPYEILVLDKDLNVIQRWSGKGGIADSPPGFTQELGWQLNGRARDVAVGPSGRIFVHVSERKDDKLTSYLDVYSPDGRFMTRIPTSEFGIDFMQFFAVGRDNVLVCNQIEPFPQIWLVDLSSYLNAAGKGER